MVRWLCRLACSLSLSAASPTISLNLTTTGQRNQMELKCARIEARIAGQNPEDFPPIPEVGEGSTWKIDPEVLRKALSRVVFAAATDESRPVLTGVYTEIEGDTMTLAAADGFRLAVHTLPVSPPAAEKVSVIVPSRAYNELNRLLTDQDDPVEVTISAAGTQLMFHLKNADMMSQLIQGTFPNYQQLIPKSYVTRSVVDVAEFLRATRLATVFARDGSGIVRLQMNSNGAEPGRVVVSARSEEIGDNVDEIDAAVEGDPAKVAFNSRYLADVLAELGSGQVALETTSPSSPGVFHPVGSDDYTHVVMPMFVQW